jgi:GT2 family glycosyltransferase
VPISATSYAVVSPVRNEQRTLGWLAVSLSRQTVQPNAWVIVDDHSTDSTWELACELQAELPWVCAMRSPRPTGGSLGQGAGLGRDVAGFTAGVASLDPAPELVGKLDGDVTLEEDYYERLLAAFAADPLLGIAGGKCWEPGPRGWEPITVAHDHVRGAARLYRRECWQTVSPLPERIGWDGVDLVRARLAGWTVRSIDSRFFHERPVGARG